MFTANYHTHTMRCRHASGTDLEYVQSAVAGGLTILGFSDHAPQCFPGEYYSGFRMFREQTEEYFTSLLSLKEAFRDKLTIKIGFESEYYPAIFNDLLQFLEPYPCDYLILGQHFLGNETDESEIAPRGTHAYLRAYVDQVCEAMRTGCFTYIAHPDLHDCSDNPTACYKECERLIACSIETNVPLEINCLGIRTHRYYPHMPFWKLAGEMGASVVIGSDAHSPDVVLDKPSVDIAHQIIAEYHLNLVEPVLRPLGKAVQ